MNELATEKTMIIREIAEALGVSYDTINRGSEMTDAERIKWVIEMIEIFKNRGVEI